MDDYEANENSSLLQTGADTQSVSSSGGSPVVSSVMLKPEKKWAGSVGEEGSGFSCATFLLCDPRRWFHRYTALMLMCFLSFGSYYVYDNPAALTQTIITVIGIDFSRYSLLYSLYSWPNVILSIFGGVLIDRVFGVRLATFLFSALVCVGQFIFAMGAIFNSFITMAAGRFVFGLGGENLAVAQNTYAVMWFKGKELNMVFGLLLSVSRIGSTVNMNTNQKLYDSTFRFINPQYVGLGILLMIGLGYCLLSLGCAVVLGFLDRRAERITQRKAKQSEERISLRDIKDFPLTLWLVFMICVAYYVTVFPFIALAVVFLEDKYDLSSSEANIINSLVYIISAVASPFLGIMVDKLGFNVIWLNLGALLTLVSHAMLAFLPASPFLPYLATVLMGLSYSLLACALWPLVALIVPEYQLGTAYGIMQAVQNLGLALVTIVSGVIVDRAGYLVLEVFFCACLCLSLIAGILLYVVDSAPGGRLNLAAWTRNKLEQKEKEEKEAKSVGKSQSADLIESGTRAGYSSPIAPSSAFHIRNRLLSRIGEKIPDHVVTFNPLTSSYAPHVGVLK